MRTARPGIAPPTGRAVLFGDQPRDFEISMMATTASAMAPTSFSATRGWNLPTIFTSLRKIELDARPGSGVDPHAAAGPDEPCRHLVVLLAQFVAPFAYGVYRVLLAFLRCHGHLPGDWTGARTPRRVPDPQPPEVAEATRVCCHLSVDGAISYRNVLSYIA